jgi:hypothetical protein
LRFIHAAAECQLLTEEKRCRLRIGHLEAQSSPPVAYPIIPEQATLSLKFRSTSVPSKRTGSS